MAKSKKELNEWLASIGIDLSKETIPDTPIDKEPATHQMGKWEAQSLLTSLHWPYPELVSVNCWECKEPFLTNYRANTYCSMLCYKKALEGRGLKWRPERTFFEQWGNLEPPLMISNESIKAMRRLIDLVDQGKIVQTDSPEPENVHTLEDQEAPSYEVSPDLPIPDTDPGIQSEPDQDSDAAFLAELDAL